MNKSKKTVVVFGESGSGKSSLVNLLLGQNKAKVSDKAIGCTFNFQKYETPNFNLYDTVGLSEGVQGTIKQEFAVTELINLLKSLDGGVSLLVFVIEKGRIKKSLNENYKLFVETICMKSVPVVLVITHCEMETIQGSWWEENKSHFDKYGMTFKAVVSGSALQPDCAPEMMKAVVKEINNKTVGELLDAIRSNWLAEAWIVKGGWSSWFYSILKGIMNIVGELFRGSKSDSPADFEKRMVAYFQSQGYDTKQANEMAKHISEELTAGPIVSDSDFF